MGSRIMAVILICEMVPRIIQTQALKKTYELIIKTNNYVETFNQHNRLHNI